MSESWYNRLASCTERLYFRIRDLARFYAPTLFPSRRDESLIENQENESDPPLQDPRSPRDPSLLQFPSRESTFSPRPLPR